MFCTLNGHLYEEEIDIDKVVEAKALFGSTAVRCFESFRDYGNADLQPRFHFD